MSEWRRAVGSAYPARRREGVRDDHSRLAQRRTHDGVVGVLHAGVHLIRHLPGRLRRKNAKKRPEKVCKARAELWCCYTEGKEVGTRVPGQDESPPPNQVLPQGSLLHTHDNLPRVVIQEQDSRLEQEKCLEINNCLL